MTSKGKLAQTITRLCPACFEKASLAFGWMPPTGVDPHLRQFECPRCGLIFYYQVTDKTLEAILALTISGAGVAKNIRQYLPPGVAHNERSRSQNTLL